MKPASTVLRSFSILLAAILTNTCADAATFEVVNLSDSGVGSLRERITLANANAGPDEIVFRADLKGVIVLTSALSPSGTLSIFGPGANVIEISGNDTVRVLQITSADANVTIEGLTLRDGRAPQQTASFGGNIHSVGQLTLRKCVVASGFCPAVTGAFGGGIYHSGGSLELDSCTIHGNVVSAATAGYGAGVYLTGGTLNAVNSTIAGNAIVTGTASLGGGVHMYSSTADFMHCTFAYNTMSGVGQYGGALSVHESSSVTVANCLLANGSGGNVAIVQGSLLSLGNNLVTDGSPGFLNGVNGDMVNVGVAAALISELGDFGGPSPTVALLQGSPAIDAIPDGDAVLPVDQRGFERADGDCGGAVLADIGAFEYGAGRGINLNGVDQCARVPVAPQFNLTSNFTIEAVVRPDHVTGVMRIVSTRGSTNGYGFGHVDGRLMFTTFAVRDYVMSTPRLTPGALRHVAVVFNSSNDAAFYVDGALAQYVLGTLPANPNNQRVYIGRNPVDIGDPQHWDGQIDEIRIWNVSRTPSQIAASYNTELTGNEPGLIGYWRFNEGQGDVSENDASETGGDSAELLKNPYWMQAPACPCDPCDTNCNGTVNQFDIDPFINAVTSHAGCSACAGDVTGDGTTNTFDIGGFLSCLAP